MAASQFAAFKSANLSGGVTEGGSTDPFIKGYGRTETHNTGDVAHDWVVRVQSSSESGKLNVGVARTADFRKKFDQALYEKDLAINVLAGAVQSQKRLLEYNSTYIAFLLDQLDEDEFEAEAEKYIVDPQDFDPESLLARVSLLVRYTGIEFDPSELADLFQCERSDIYAAVEQGNSELSSLTSFIQLND